MTASAVSLKEIVEAVVQLHRDRVGPLLRARHSIQDRLGFIPADAVPMIAVALGLSRAEVHGVIGFYHDFRDVAPGEHVLQLCRAEACQAMGARELEAHARSRLGVDFGETTPDGRVTLEAVYCLGNCACSPSIRIDDEVHARVTPDRFDALLAGLEDGEE